MGVNLGLEGLVVVVGVGGLTREMLGEGGEDVPWVVRVLLW